MLHRPPAGFEGILTDRFESGLHLRRSRTRMVFPALSLAAAVGGEDALARQEGSRPPAAPSPAPHKRALDLQQGCVVRLVRLDQPLLAGERVISADGRCERLPGRVPGLPAPGRPRATSPSRWTRAPWPPAPGAAGWSRTAPGPASLQSTRPSYSATRPPPSASAYTCTTMAPRSSAPPRSTRPSCASSSAIPSRLWSLVTSPT